MIEIKPKTEHGIVHRSEGTFFSYHGWPSVCKDSRGVVYAAASGMRITHVDPCGKNCLYLSFDEGKTWTPPVIVNDSFLDDRDTGIFAWGNGNMIVSWFTEIIEDRCETMMKYDWLSEPHKKLCKAFAETWDYLTPEQREVGSYVKMSGDYGVTWSKPVKVPVTSPHGPVVLKDGTIVYMGKYMNPDYLADNPICVYSSHDGGYTWEFTGQVRPSDDISNFHMHEPHMIELPNGRLLGAIRVHARETQPDYTVYTSYSDDKGKTWSKPVCIGVDGSPPHLMVHSSGAVICSYSRRRSETDRGERACVSYDNGETWSEDYDLRSEFASSDHGYPASVELSDGSILTVYYMSYGQSWDCCVLSTRWRLGDKQ